MTGDRVANAEPGSSQVQQHPVDAVHITDDDKDFTDLTVSTPAGPKDITSTAHHLFWDATTQNWIDAAGLKPGEQLATPGDGRATLAATHSYTGGIRTYNLTVDAVHTYYVLAGETPVLVHHCGTTPKITDDGLAHSFDRHAAQWFGGNPTRAVNMAEWRGIIERASQSAKVVPWTTGATKTFAYISRIDGKWFVAQFDRASGELVTAFVPNSGQVGAMLGLLGQ